MGCRVITNLSVLCLIRSGRSQIPFVFVSDFCGVSRHFSHRKKNRLAQKVDELIDSNHELINLNLPFNGYRCLTAFLP